MNALKIALQFLTRLPVAQADYNEADLKASLYWYGAVGVIIGAILWLTHSLLVWCFPLLSDLVLAALLLGLWIMLTGALHLDGLADSADAWLGGQNRERTLEIMKDPRSGPAGVVALLWVLLLKFACLSALLPGGGIALLLAPALARGLMPILFLHTPYVRENGLAAPFKEGLSREAVFGQAALIGLLCLLCLGFSALWLAALVAATYWGLRRLMLTRLGGTTGDTAGASIEIIEATVLLGLVLAAA